MIKVGKKYMKINIMGGQTEDETELLNNRRKKEERIQVSKLNRQEIGNRKNDRKPEEERKGEKKTKLPAKRREREKSLETYN